AAPDAGISVDAHRLRALTAYRRLGVSPALRALRRRCGGATGGSLRQSADGARLFAATLRRRIAVSALPAADHSAG
nr:hypothetical protein [Tanacetum cinerariifolium]